MIEEQLSYSIIQFSPRPERFEFVNVGVIVFDGGRKSIVPKLSDDFSRVKKVFGDASPSFLSVALHDYVERIEFEYAKLGARISEIDFNAKRSDIFQLTPVLPVMGQNAFAVAQDLYSELVQVSIKSKRAENVSTQLARGFHERGVLSLLQKRPKAVEIPKYGVSIKADFGYQNGVYNLIDAARFDASERGLAEAGKRILEGRALADTLSHRLIVVGDFAEKSGDFIESLKEDFRTSNSKLFAIDELDLLSEEIKRTAH